MVDVEIDIVAMASSYNHFMVICKFIMAIFLAIAVSSIIILTDV